MGVREFMGSTPEEYFRRVDGYRQRMDRQQDMSAEWMCVLIKVLGGEDPTARKLLGRPLVSDPDYNPKAES